MSRTIDETGIGDGRSRGRITQFFFVRFFENIFLGF